MSFNDQHVAIQMVLDNLKNTYLKKYGYAVFDIKITEGEDGLYIFDGYVLSENQKNNLQCHLEEVVANFDITSVRVLSDASVASNSNLWAVVNRDFIDFKTRFVSNSIINEKILHRIVSGRVFKNEILRILRDFEDQYLVQCSDLTLGWVNKNEVRVSEVSLLSKWRSGRIAPKGKMLSLDLDLQQLVVCGKKFLGVDYVLGGNDVSGIDCSALTQFIYKQGAQIILPRHSWDQKQIGEAVRLQDARVGDLCFFIHKVKQTKHVGLVSAVVGSIIKVLHSCLAEKGVVEQDLEVVLQQYNLMEIRRIIK